MNHSTDATAIFAPLWRRKWLILAVGIAVGVASYFYYKQQPPTYAASTQLYLGAEEQAPGEKGSTKLQAVTSSAQTSVINLIIVEKVRQQMRAEHEGALVRGAKVRAKAPEKGEFITISTEASSARVAARLANLTAQTYISRQRVRHRRVIESAIAITRRQLNRLEAASAPTRTPGKKGGSTTRSTASILQATTLSTKINELEASLGVAGATQVKPASALTAERLSPQPRKNAIFGFVLGLVLAAIAAYVLSRYDNRLRSLAVIDEVFPSPILAAMPKVTRPITDRDGSPAPSRILLEPLRRMHTSLQLAGKLDGGGHPSARVLLFISPDPGDGKSTLVADLALVQRDAGERVAVVEANFRRPRQARLLGVDDARGLADVLAGTVALEDAMQRVFPAQAAAAADPTETGQAVATAVEARSGSLFLLAGGRSVLNPPAVMAQPGMRGLLETLEADFDYVLIDAPSPLEFSDVMPLLGLVQGIVVVLRVGHTREMAAQRLSGLLAQSSSAPVLGTVANCVGRADSERYGFSARDGRVWSGKLIGR
jgi:Mrp family chromosome partitioning ATPase